MHVREISALLAAHRVFGLLPDVELAALTPQWQHRRVASGEIVLAESEMPVRLGLLVSGGIDLVDQDAAWRLPLEPQELFGAGATVADHDDAQRAVATAPSEVLFLDVETLRELVQRNPRLLPLLPAIPRRPARASRRTPLRSCAFRGSRASGWPRLPWCPRRAE